MISWKVVQLALNNNHSAAQITADKINDALLLTLNIIYYPSLFSNFAKASKALFIFILPH
jgi:hypothetical protein